MYNYKIIIIIMMMITTAPLSKMLKEGHNGVRFVCALFVFVNEPDRQKALV
jgi:hypothetical protein